MTPRKHGQCHICGESGFLSFEHIPPEAAFNDQRVLESNIKKLMEEDLLEHLENPEGKYNQRGSGKHTLCERCNSTMGGWYARAYVSFVKQAFPACQRVSTGSTAIFKCQIYPLRVLKQILSMFCSASPPSFAKGRPKLVRYLLNRESREQEADLKVYLGLFDIENSKATRQSGITGRLSGDDMQSHVYSEISFPPFNIVLAIRGGAPDARLADISFFSDFDYHQSAEITLSLNPLPVNSQFPADYRTVSEIEETVRSSGLD